MLDKKNPEDEPRQKRSFIREKVVKQPLTRRQILFRAGCVILAAAACACVLASPLQAAEQRQEPCLRWSAL